MLNIINKQSIHVILQSINNKGKTFIYAEKYKTKRKTRGMVEKSTVFAEKLKHTGYWNFRDLYNFCYLWLQDEGYLVEEHEYNEKIVANGKEIIIKWRAWKKVSDYFKNVIELKWRILRMVDSEIEIEGKKQKTNHGEVEIKFESILERDYEERWEVSPTYKFFRAIYDKYIIKQTWDEYEDRLADKTATFVQQIKAFLVLEGRA